MRVYSQFLPKTYDTHLYVEIVSSIRLIKYCKYMCQGHDWANGDVTDSMDKIQARVDARYVGSSEAVWRLVEFPVHGSSHSM